MAKPNSDQLEAFLDQIETDEDANKILSILNEIEFEEAQINPLSKFKPGNPIQDEMIQAFKDDDKDFIIALAGNRSGKTFGMVGLMDKICLGEFPEARHQPDPNRLLQIWFVGRDYNVLNDTVLKTIKEFLRPAEEKKTWWTKKDGPQVTRVYIKAANGGLCEIIFKPTTGDLSIFESAGPHYIFVDEGVKPEIFSALIARMTGNDAMYIQCFTRLPHTIAENFLGELEHGEGEFKNMAPFIKFIHGTVEDNPFLTDREVDRMKLAYENDPLEYKARILGIVDKPRGAVFDFKDLKDGKPYNRFEFKELKPLLDNGTWVMMHDYGFRDASVFILVFLHHDTGTAYFVDEVYGSGFTIEQAGHLVHDMLVRWDCYHKIELCVADKQIKNEGSKSERCAETNILSQYLTVTEEDGTPSFPPGMGWRCKEREKRNPAQSLQLINTLLTSENDYTPGKPFYRFSVKCYKTMKELKTIRWKEASQASGSREVTRGDDHAVAALRYFSMYRTNIGDFYNRHNIVEDKYEAILNNKSRGGYFNF